MGNRVFPSPGIRAATEEALTAEVGAFLRRTEWSDGEEVVVSAWEDATSSPSTQLWIEPGAPPRLDGIYEQVLKGREQVFRGQPPDDSAGTGQPRPRRGGDSRRNRPTAPRIRGSLLFRPPHLGRP